MNKTSSAIYGISGMLICVLAIFSFVHDSGSLLQRLMMLSGLLIFGVMFLGFAIANLRGHLKRVMPNRGDRWSTQRLALTTGALILLVGMLSWVMATRGVTAQGIAIALVLLPNLFDDWVQVLIARRQHT